MVMVVGLVSVGQAWTLLDNFDSYDNSASTRTTIATGGVGPVSLTALPTLTLSITGMAKFSRPWAAQRGAAQNAI